MPVVRRSSSPAPAPSPAAPDAKAAAAANGRPGQPQSAVAPSPTVSATATDFSKVSAEALTYWLFNAPPKDQPESARAHEFVRGRRGELEKVLIDATEKTERVLTAGFLAGAKPDAVRKRAEELVTIAIAELRRPLKEPQMVDLLLATPASLEAAFMKLASFNIPVCSAANLARFTVRKNNGILIVQPQPEIGGLFDAAQGVVARMEGMPDGSAPKFSVSAHVVREQDHFIRTTTEERESVEFRPNDRPDTTKPNGYVGAFAVVRAGNQLPLIAYLPEAVLASRTQAGKLGQNVFYAKAPDRELTNIVTREALRKFLVERANSFVHRLAQFDLGVQTMFEDDQGSAATPGQHAAKFSIALEPPTEPTPGTGTGGGFSFANLFKAKNGTEPSPQVTAKSAEAAPQPPAAVGASVGTPSESPAGAVDAPAPQAPPTPLPAETESSPVEPPKAVRRPRRQLDATAQPAASATAEPSSPPASPSNANAPSAAPAVPVVIRVANPQDEEELALS